MHATIPQPTFFIGCIFLHKMLKAQTFDLRQLFCHSTCDLLKAILDHHCKTNVFVLKTTIRSNRITNMLPSVSNIKHKACLCLIDRIWTENLCYKIM